MALQPMRLTTEDVADLLRVSEARVRQYVEEGRLVARTEGSKRLYFLPHEVQAFCLAMPVYGAGAVIDAADHAPVTFRRRGSKRPAEAATSPAQASPTEKGLDLCLLKRKPLPPSRTSTPVTSARRPLVPG